MNRQFLVFVLMVCACWAVLPMGCDDGDGGGGDTDTDTDTDSDTDTDTDSDADWGMCMAACDEPSDCVAADADETKDENNWSCESGHCEFLGCQNTAECQSLFPDMTNIECNTNVEPHGCTLPCTSPADCEVSGTVLYSEDNWACESDLCVLTGCNSDDECEEAHPGEDVACADYMDTPLCFVSCEEAVDCTDSAVTADLFNEDHWMCSSGVCEHRGCNSTQECEDSTVYGAGFICVF